MATKSADPNNSETYGINLPTAMVIASFCTIAWVNTIELQFRIWLGFKRYVGLYFWALIVSSWGCTFHPLGFIFLDFGIIKQANAVGVIIGISWWCMVTGQALVLYSRLHLVVRDKRKIRWVLVMIVTNFFILHLPIMVLSQCVSIPREHHVLQGAWQPDRRLIHHRPTLPSPTQINGSASTKSTKKPK